MMKTFTPFCLAVVMLLMLLLTGCTATSVLIGVREPKLSKLVTNAPRARVERTLGKRLWHAGSAEGVTYDIYQFKAAKGPRPVSGTIALGLDFFTLGLFEANISDLKRYAPVKQIAITYDARDCVQAVSLPWTVTSPGPCRNRRSLVPADSGVPTNVRPPPLARLSDSDAQVAILQRERAIHLTVDGRKLIERELRLKPGTHEVSFGSVLGGSVLYGAMFLSYEHTFGKVDLLPGRIYRVKTVRLYDLAPSREDFFWIQDMDSGETIGCTRPGAQ